MKIISRLCLNLSTVIQRLIPVSATIRACKALLRTSRQL